VATRLRRSGPDNKVDLWARMTSGILGRGAMSFLLASAGVNASNFLFHVVVSRLLGPAHYGAVGAILSILGLLAVPVGAAQLAVTQAVIGNQKRKEAFSLGKLIGRAIVVGLIAMLAFVALTPTVDSFLHLNSPLPLFLVALWIPLATIAAVLQGALIGEYKFRAVAFATFVGGGPVRLLFGGVMVGVGFGVTGAVIATLFAQAFTTASLLFSLRHSIRHQPHMSAIRTSRRDMGLSIAAICSYTALIGADTFLARHFLSAFVAGQYAAGAVAAHIALFIPGAIVTVAFPHWASGEGTSAASRSAFAQAFKITIFLGLLTAAALAVLSSLVVHVLFGTSYAGAIGIVGILSFASATIGVVNLFVYLHLARRSRFSLTPWLGVVLASVLISLHHKNMGEIAWIMLIVSVLTLLAILIPALLAFAVAKVRDAAADVSIIELPVAEIDLTLVVPFYNPGSRLRTHLEEIARILAASDISYEIVAVSDGSTDQSEDQLKGLEIIPFTLVRLDHNQGKGAALRAGLSIGRGEYLGFIDGDGDLPAELLINLMEIVQQQHPDIIYGSKRHSRSKVIYPPLRRFYSWSYQQLNRLLFRLPVRDTQTGIKVVRRDVLAAILPRMVEKRFAFDLELFVVARQQGFRNFVEMPVTIIERFTSTVSVRSVRNMLIDTCAIFYRLRVLRFYERDVRGKPDADLFARWSESSELAPKEVISPLLDPHSQRRLRILILNWRDVTNPRAGGAEIYTQNIANEWVREGHNVTLFCASVKGGPSYEDFDGVQIIRRGSSLSVYRHAKRFYRREGRGQFDLVIEEINTRPFFARKWVTDVPLVALIHQVCRELWYYQFPRPFATLGRYWFEPRWLNGYRDTMTVTVSESSERSLRAYGLRHVVTVPEGHRELAERPVVERETNPTVVFVGRLEAHKRPEDAIEAFGLLRQSMATAVLWVIGSGSMQDKLRLSAPEGVHFLGKVSPAEKIARLARAHVLIVTSVREGWGLVVTEAAGVGTPTIAYDVPGLSDSVRASNGVLVTPDPKHLAACLNERLQIWQHEGLPEVAPGGVVPWDEVAKRILYIASQGNSSLHSERVSQDFKTLDNHAPRDNGE